MWEKKKTKRHSEVTFKAYEQHQGMLFMPSFDELIPSDYLVRLVSRAIDGMHLETLMNAYTGGGASNYHPKMLLKVLVYGYIDRLYSSRRLEKATRENINFMWLTGLQTPDHNTINRFRKGRLKDTIKDVFAAVLLVLIEEGIVRLEDYHIDGTKIESAANRYTFVWAKSISGHKQRLPAKINALLDEIESTNDAEEAAAQANDSEGDSASGSPKIEDSERLAQTIANLKEHLQDTNAPLACIGKTMPQRASADAGYGSEENYGYLESEGMENYVKYPGFYQEQRQEVKNNPFRVENLHYNAEEDYFVCSMGQHLTFRYTTKIKSKNGYESSARIYQAQRCARCPLRSACHKAKTDRIIQVNPNLQRHKDQARQNLWSLQGIRLRQKRCIEPEPVFGQIKWNRGFKRFLLRGMSKVTCEFGIVAIAHNLKKMWVRLQQAHIVPIPPVLPPNNAQISEKSAKNHFFDLLAIVASLTAPRCQNQLALAIAA